MDMRIVHVHLAKTGHAMFDARFAKHAESTVILDVIIESDFGAWEQADRYVGMTDFGKAACNRLNEIGGDELVRDLGRPRGDEMQTIVAHGKGTPLKGRVPALFS
jgi:hypothetical protein